MKRLICLTGYAGSGKDFVADRLATTRGFVKHAIANGLKYDCMVLYNIPWNLMETPDGKRTVWEEGKTVREILVEEAKLQKLVLGEDTFIKRLLVSVETNGHSNEQIVISDVRFLPEWTAIVAFAQQHGYSVELWRIVRDGVTASPGDETVAALPATRTLFNHGTAADLEKQISAFLQETP